MGLHCIEERVGEERGGGCCVSNNSLLSHIISDSRPSSVVLLHPSSLLLLPIFHGNETIEMNVEWRVERVMRVIGICEDLVWWVVLNGSVEGGCVGMRCVLEVWKEREVIVRGMWKYRVLM